MLSKYRSKDGRSIATIDTVDLLSILAVFLGFSIATTGLPEIFGVLFANYSYSLAGTSFGLGVVMVVGGLFAIITTNGLSREEFLNVNSLEGVTFSTTAVLLGMLVLEPTVIVDYVINNPTGQVVVSVLGTVVAGLLSTQ